jgi:hypothetical protein
MLGAVTAFAVLAQHAAALQSLGLAILLRLVARADEVIE